MPDYQSMYLHLFNAVTDALAIMDKGSGPAEMLRQAQRECEDMYVSGGESPELFSKSEKIRSQRDN